MPHCPLPKLLCLSSPYQALAKQPSSPFSSSSYFPPASEAKQNAVLTKNNNCRQIQTMDKPPARARATRILPEEDGIIRRPLRHLSIAAVGGPQRLSMAVRATPPKRLPSGAGAHGGLGQFHVLILLVQRQQEPSPPAEFWCDWQSYFSDASVYCSPQRGGWPGCGLPSALLPRLLPCFPVLACSVRYRRRGVSLDLPPFQQESHHQGARGAHHPLMTKLECAELVPMLSRPLFLLSSGDGNRGAGTGCTDSSHHQLSWGLEQSLGLCFATREPPVGMWGDEDV